MRMVYKVLAFCTLLFLQNTVFATGNNLTDLFYDKHSPFAGNPDGKVMVVEFFDYQCAHCIAMAPVIAQILQANPDVKIIFKDFPIRGPISETAAKAALAANLQGKYYALSHALLSSSLPLSDANILATASSLGLDMTRLKADMAGAMVKSQLVGTEQLAETLKLPGTPAFYIANKDAKSMQDVKYVLGAMTVNELQTEITKALKR